MLNLSIDPAVYTLLFFHCLMGGIAALVAKQKGYNYWLWLTFGFIGGTVAFIVILMMKKKEEEADTAK